MLDTPVMVHVEAYRAADDGDTASLSVAGLPAATPLAVAAGDPRVGDPVTSIGYAGMNLSDTDGVNLAAFGDNTLDAAGLGQSVARMLQDSRLQPVNTSGTITSRQYRDGIPVYQVSADFDQGMSGGPTINSNGEVYGLNSQMTVPFFGQNFNVVTDTGMLRRALHANTTGNGTAGTTRQSQTGGENGSPVESISATPTGSADTSGANTGDAPGRVEHDPADRVDYSGALVSLLTGLAGIGLGWGLARRTRTGTTDRPVDADTTSGDTASGDAEDAATSDAGIRGTSTPDTSGADAVPAGEQNGR